MSSVDLGTGGADVAPSSCMERLANGLTPAVCHPVEGLWLGMFGMYTTSALGKVKETFVNFQKEWNWFSLVNQRQPVTFL